VVADEWALREGSAQGWPNRAVTMCYGLFVAQAAILGLAAGRFLAGWFLRWMLLGWVLVLIDLRLFSLVIGQDIPYHSGRCLAFAFLAGQLGLLAVWAAAGPVPWPWRIPAALVGATLAIYLGDSFHVWGDVWTLLLLVQTAVFAGLCLLLCLGGLSLKRVEEAGVPGERFGGTGGFQFSIRHMLFWMVAAVPILVLAQRLDLWFVKDVAVQVWLGVILIALALGVVSLVATWAALGRGPAVVWLGALALVPPAVGLVLVAIPVGTPVVLGGARYFVTNQLGELRWWWVAWTILAAWFLAGLLLVFRAGGYRLARRGRREIRPHAVIGTRDVR
jgi:hypothetical protein